MAEGPTIKVRMLKDKNIMLYGWLKQELKAGEEVEMPAQFQGLCDGPDPFCERLPDDYEPKNEPSAEKVVIQEPPALQTKPDPVIEAIEANASRNAVQEALTPSKPEEAADKPSPRTTRKTARKPRVAKKKG